MATTRVQRNSHYAAIATGDHAGIGVNPDDNRLYVNPHSGVGRIPFKCGNVVVLTTNRTALAGESGTTFIASSTTSIVLTLPATAAGLEFTLINAGLTTTGTGHSISPASVDKIIGNGFSPADDKDAMNTAATDVIGDMITVIGDGVDGWYIKDIKGTWAKES